SSHVRHVTEQLSTPNATRTQIQWTLGLPQCHARHRLQINHSRSDVRVAEQPLDRLEIIVGQQQMARESRSPTPLWAGYAQSPEISSPRAGRLPMFCLSSFAA